MTHKLVWFVDKVYSVHDLAPEVTNDAGYSTGATSVPYFMLSVAGPPSKFGCSRLYALAVIIQ